jgi:hypothetical protein
MSKKSAHEYEVGKGKPPKNHQWRSGQSGNPSGRKKGVKKKPPTIVEALMQEFAETLPFVIDGKRVDMDTNQIFAKKFQRLVLNARDLSELRRAADVLAKVGYMKSQAALLASSNDDTSDDDDVSPFTEEDRRLLDIVRRASEDDEWEDEGSPSPGGNASPPGGAPKKTGGQPFEFEDWDDDEEPSGP